MNAPPLLAPAPARAPARAILLALAGLFILPFLLAAGLHLAGWRPAGNAGHGELLQPPRPMPPTGLSAPDGRPLALSQLGGRWQLVLAGRGPCAACRQGLADQAQIQRLLPKFQGQLGRLWLADPAALAHTPDWAARWPGLQAASPDAAWQQALELPADGFNWYLVDPAGRLVMRYPAETSPAGIRQDLERLLKYSWPGARPAAPPAPGGDPS